MRTPLLLLCTALTLTLAPTLPAQVRALPTYTDAQASEHAGEEAHVTGNVFGVSTRGIVTFVNVGAAFPNHTFTGVVFSGDQDKVGDLQQYNGKTVTISGKIELRQDKPQIVIKGPEQIRLSEAGAPPPPSAPTPTPAAPMPKSSAPVASTTTPTPTAAAPTARKLMLAQNWDAPAQTGAMTRKDLALLFSGQGASSGSATDEAAIVLYGGIPYLEPLAETRKRLNIETAIAANARVTCPGLPAGSFTAHTYSGVFEGGFNRLLLVTDLAEQIVSVLVLDENSRQQVANEPDSTGYHTYNFIQHRVKGSGDLAIRHKIAPGKGGVIIIETMLIDPTEGAKPPTRSTSSRSTTTTTRSTASKTGKVLERSRWYVPAPVADLILRCAASSR